MFTLMHLTFLHQRHAAGAVAISSSAVSLPRNGDPIKLNGAIHVSCTIRKLVAASAAEAELGVLFLNAQEAKVFSTHPCQTRPSNSYR
jgi:hypothetical protein